jgi:ATP-binding cassette subfamily B protein RaxB
MLKLQGERLADIVLTPPETEVLVPPRQDLTRRLELRNVGFRYSDAEPRC